MNNSDPKTQSLGRENHPTEDMLLTGILVIAAIWFLLPLACILILRLPPYALGHEQIGVRFFQAWVPLHDHGRYPFLMVGFLLDLFHRGLLFILMRFGYDPAKDLIRVMTVFANVSILVHTFVLVATSIVIARNRALPLSFRLLIVLSGASLGYTFYWAPYHLFFADYQLTLIVLGYIFLAFVSARLCPTQAAADSAVKPAVTIWRRAASIGCLAAAMLFLKPTLVAYAFLTFWLGALKVPREQRFKVIGSALGIALVLMVLAWFVLQQSGLRGGFSAARALLSGLLHVTSAEPFFRPRDLITPGTIYFVPILGCVLWLLMVVLTVAFPRDRRLRSLPLVVLAGGLLYAYAMVRRPGNATIFEALVYVVLTGTLCLMVQSPRVQRVTLLAWVAVLLVHTGAIARVTVLSFAWSGRHTAEIAGQIDEYARSFNLPIVYLYPDRGPAAYNLLQSAESAVISGSVYCKFRDVECSSAYQNQWLSGLKPYQLARPLDALPSGKFVLLFADVPFAPSVVQESRMARGALARAHACRQWEQSGFTVHVCEIPTGSTRGDSL